MMIPSIDLMNGRAVQLRQGKTHVLTDERDPIALAREFNRYGEIAVIDLDAALGKGDNLALIKQICRVADVRAGGGVRTVERANALLRAGAQRIIVGTAATPEFLSQLPKARVMVALDHRHGEVVDLGWTHGSGQTVSERALALADHCSAYLCTFVTEEGCMTGLPVDEAQAIQAVAPHPLTVAGGVASTDEVIALSRMGLDVQVGMALYTGQLDPAAAVIGALDFDKQPLIPTIVEDEAGQTLMLAYSTPESLRKSLENGHGVYYSRSRQKLWRKGETSGHQQELLACRTDCDRDTLLFTVRQSGPACHTHAYSCFGSGQRNRRFSLPALFEILRDRMAHPPAGSYTARLFADPELLAAKIMEEAQEAIEARERDDVIWEIADAVFFLSALAVREGLDWRDIEAELGGRHK
ncbi:MAG: phosphoribosyl-ATP diphosphatase [Vampirovibrionales bacterium]|nr:phosphoribosyl-ATP diphosphatase [Vampirovibrionales bacterium]